MHPKPIAGITIGYCQKTTLRMHLHIGGGLRESHPRIMFNTLFYERRVNAMTVNMLITLLYSCMIRGGDGSHKI